MDATLEVLKANVGNSDDSFTKGRKEVVKHLRRHKERCGDVEFRQRNLVLDEDNEDGQEKDQTSSTLQRFNEKLKQKEQDRMQRMNRGYSAGPYQEGEICSSPMEVIQHSSQYGDNCVFEENGSELLSESEGEMFLSCPSSNCIGGKQGSLDGNTEGKKSPFANGFYYESTNPDSDVTDSDNNALVYDECVFPSEDFEIEEEVDESENENDSPSIELEEERRTSNYRNREVASLVTEKTAQWLIDDIGYRNAKRKRPTKQTKLTGSVVSKKRFSGPVKHRVQSNQRKSKFSGPKQTTLNVSKEPRTETNALIELDSPMSVMSTTVNARHKITSKVATGTSRNTSHEINTMPNVTSGGTPPMRLRVRVQDKVFLIPCPKNDAQESKNIGWLAEQVGGVCVSIVPHFPVGDLNIRQQLLLYFCFFYYKSIKPSWTMPV